MYKCIIVDDELLAIKRLRSLLSKYERNYKVIESFTNANSMLDYLMDNEVNIIFLDIEMPGLNGLEAIKKIPSNIQVVFMTAYRDYAVEAFENDAFDYILKPVSQERFDKTLLKIESNLRLISIDSNTKDSIKELTQLPVKIGDKTIFINISDIVFFKSDTKYSELNTKDGKKYLLPNTLTVIEEKLPSFIRIHRGILINNDYILEIRKYFNSRVKIFMNDIHKTSLISGRAYMTNINLLKKF